MMKKSRPLRRQIFVFTAEEKKVAAFVLAAFLLGVGSKYYRDHHPHPPELSERQRYQAERATRVAAAEARSAHARRRATATRPTPSPPRVNDDEEE